VGALLQPRASKKNKKKRRNHFPSISCDLLASGALVSKMRNPRINHRNQATGAKWWQAKLAGVNEEELFRAVK